MGLVIVLVPANFPRDPHPAWRFYDALPDPVGWVLVLAGVWALARHAANRLDLDPLAGGCGRGQRAAVVPAGEPPAGAGVQPAIEVSFQWFVALPQTLFSLLLVAHDRPGQRSTRSPADTFVAGRFGVLTWGWSACWCCPSVAYGGGVEALEDPTLLLIGLVNVAVVLLPVPRAPATLARRPRAARGAPGGAVAGLAGRPARPSYSPSETATSPACEPLGKWLDTTGPWCSAPAELERQADTTLRLTCASTSSCTRTVTVWAPSDLIGLPTTMVRLSTWSPGPSR